MIRESLRALAKSVHIRGPNSDLSGPNFRLQGKNWPWVKNYTWSGGSQGLEGPGSLILGSLRALGKSIQHISGPISNLSGPTSRLQGQKWPLVKNDDPWSVKSRIWRPLKCDPYIAKGPSQECTYQWPYFRSITFLILCCVSLKLQNICSPPNLVNCQISCSKTWCEGCDTELVWLLNI